MPGHKEKQPSQNELKNTQVWQERLAAAKNSETYRKFAHLIYGELTDDQYDLVSRINRIGQSECIQVDNHLLTLVIIARGLAFTHYRKAQRAWEKNSAADEYFRQAHHFEACLRLALAEGKLTLWNISQSTEDGTHFDTQLEPSPVLNPATGQVAWYLAHSLNPNSHIATMEEWLRQYAELINQSNQGKPGQTD